MKNVKTPKKTKNTYWKILIILLAVTAVLNILGCFEKLCDTYRSYVYKYIADGLGYITGLLPFALGEIIMYLGAAVILVGIILSLILVFLRKHEGYRRFTVRYLKALLFAVVVLLLIYTVNWILPFRASVFGQRQEMRNEFSGEELVALRSYLVDEINELSQQVERDSEGHIIYSESVDKDVIMAMKKLGETYPDLSGYYPKPKVAGCSDLLDWMGIGGYTYPYTMEVTCNKYVDKLYYPSLLTHEMAHHKGFYKEGEANFISFLACTGADNTLLQYAGYLDAFYYVDKAYVELLDVTSTSWVEAYLEQPQLLGRVYLDQEEALNVAKEVYSNDNHAAEALAEVTADIAEKGWSTQADMLKENNYDGVVLMLLQYYDGTLYKMGKMMTRS